MDRQLFSKRESFNFDIRRRHHKKILCERRQRLGREALNHTLTTLTEQVQLSHGQQKAAKMMDLANFIGEDELFHGVAHEPHIIQHWCNRILELLVKIALNPQSNFISTLALAGLANLTGDPNFNDQQAIEELILFVQQLRRTRVSLTRQQTQEIQWTYANILLKPNLNLSDKDISNMLCVLTDIHSYRDAEEKLRKSVAGGLSQWAVKHPNQIAAQKSYMTDFARGMLELITVEERQFSLQMFRFCRKLISHDCLLLAMRETEMLIIKCIEMLASQSNVLKEESFRLMTCLVQRQEFHGRFIIWQYCQKLVKHLQIEDMRLKELILDLLNEILETQHEKEIRQALVKAHLFEVLRNRCLDCRCFDVISKAMDLIIRCVQWDNGSSSVGLLKRLSAMGFSNVIQKVSEKNRNIETRAHFEDRQKKFELVQLWLANVQDI